MSEGSVSNKSRDIILLFYYLTRMVGGLVVGLMVLLVSSAVCFSLKLRRMMIPQQQLQLLSWSRPAAPSRLIVWRLRQIWRIYYLMRR